MSINEQNVYEHFDLLKGLKLECIDLCTMAQEIVTLREYTGKEEIISMPEVFSLCGILPKKKQTKKKQRMFYFNLYIGYFILPFI